VKGVETQDEDMVVFFTMVIYGCSHDHRGLEEKPNHHPVSMQACMHTAHTHRDALEAYLKVTPIERDSRSGEYNVFSFL